MDSVSHKTHPASSAPAIIAESAPDEPHALQDRMIAAWEIISVVSSALIAEWVVLSLAGRNRIFLIFPIAFAFILILFSHRTRGETARDVGLRVDNFLAAARLLIPPMFIAAILCAFIGWLSDGFSFSLMRGERSLLWIPTRGAVWGFVQQYVLQGFINRRAQIIWGQGRWSVLATALVFAALHLPNPWLTIATFCGGVVWAYIYQIAPNLFALALSHSFMTFVLISTIPSSVFRGLRVGFKYFG